VVVEGAEGVKSSPMPPRIYKKSAKKMILAKVQRALYLFAVELF
jgi:hypothetical protein